jgi:hypothetical protein
MKSKGVFCLEGDWWNCAKRSASVEPILALLAAEPYRVPYFHLDVRVREAFDAGVQLWSQRRFCDYPILYLAFHANGQTLIVGDARHPQSGVTLDDLEELLAGKCHKRLIFMGGCLMMQAHGRRLGRFLRTTGALAICGYREVVDWLESTAFELLVLGSMQENALTISGVRAMGQRIRRDGGSLAKRLGFRLVVRS